MGLRLPPFSSWTTDLTNGTVTLSMPGETITVRGASASQLLDWATGASAEPPEFLRQYAFSDSVDMSTVTRLEHYLAGELGGQIFAKQAARSIQGFAFEVNVLIGERAYHGHGRAPDRETALTKAAVEVYERISSDGNRNVPMGSLTSAVPRVTRGWTGAGDANDGPWLNGTDLRSGAVVAMPFAEGCFPHRLPAPVSFRANSNGVASHTSTDRAECGALLEVIERDAVLIWWFTDRAADRLAPPPEIADVEATLASLGTALVLLDATVDTAPCVIAGSVPEDGASPGVMIAAAARTSLLEAAVAAAHELELGALYAAAWRAGMGATPVRGPVEHSDWHAARPSGTLAQRLRAGAAQDPLSPSSNFRMTSEVGGLVEALGRAGVNAYSFPLNLIGAEATGLQTRRILAPKLMPLTFGYSSEPLNHPRLATAAKKLKTRVSARATLAGYEPHPLG